MKKIYSIMFCLMTFILLGNAIPANSEPFSVSVETETLLQNLESEQGMINKINALDYVGLIDLNAKLKALCKNRLIHDEVKDRATALSEQCEIKMRVIDRQLRFLESYAAGMFGPRFVE